MPRPCNVIITAWNQGKFLEETIRSLLAQSQRPAELLYVDDGSTDNSVEIARRFPEVRVLALEHQGVAKARNAGYAALKSAYRDAPYVMFADGDDKYSVNYLAAGCAALEADLRLGAAYPHITRFDENGSSSWSGNRPYDYDALASENYVPSPSVLRREAFESAGGWQDVLDRLWDWDLWLRMTRLGWSLQQMPESAILFYRLHNESNSARARGHEWENYRDIQMRLPVTVFTPFAAGRPWSLDLWVANLQRSGLPLERAHLVAMDNTGDGGFAGRLLDAAWRLRPRAVTLLPGGDFVGVNNFTTRCNGDVTAYMCALWRRATPHFDGDLLWSLEDDIRLRDDAYARLVSALRPRVGVVGPPVVSRWRRPFEIMTYALHSKSPWELARLPNGRTDYRRMRREGVEEVGAVSTSCLIVRRCVFHDHAPMESANGDGRWSGHEFAMLRRCHQLGYSVLCHWDVKADHLINERQELTVEMWREAVRHPGYYRQAPDLGQITKPCGPASS